ncbi:TdeIII family type II restriction endonuclease [Curtobacterium sp. UCD-KPL2560]|uniref:TdeIII family type II restriction endonuclease n=1 Tax=Curtobacterium sp. UCD-KPL2560 TaxID=1885315 RepID=UPI001495F963|nr:TdeIII family type II restriction endonuclease [Curtobacterium sp. UCD-KPL2560]
MTIPRDKLLSRLNSNVDTLLSTYQGRRTQLYTVEVSDPFRSSGNSGAASPFIKTVFPEIKVAATLERALNTALGWGWDKVVADIAKATHGNGIHDHHVTGSIPAVTATTIESIINSYRDKPRRLPDTTSELSTVLSTASLGGAQESVSEKDDAFYIDSHGVEHHIEIKTPKPNYDQMRAAKRRILRIHAARSPLPVRSIVGMPYNPNGRWGAYGWPTTRIYLDSGVDLLVGEAFWNYIGASDDTYDELIDCFYEVGRARKQELLSLLTEV